MLQKELNTLDGSTHKIILASRPTVKGLEKGVQRSSDVTLLRWCWSLFRDLCFFVLTDLVAKAAHTILMVMHVGLVASTSKADCKSYFHKGMVHSRRIAARAMYGGRSASMLSPTRIRHRLRALLHLKCGSIYTVSGRGITVRPKHLFTKSCYTEPKSHKEP